MYTAKVKLEELQKWEEDVNVALRILINGRNTSIWSGVCSEALRDLVRLRRELDRKIHDTIGNTEND